MRNLTVVAFNSVDGYYYPGYRHVSDDPSACKVSFLTLQPAELPGDKVIPFGGAVPTPLLSAGNTVLVMVRHGCTKDECYVPGIVLCLPKDHPFMTPKYTVQLYNRKSVYRTRRELIRIGIEKYEEIKSYIEKIHGHRIQCRTKPKDKLPILKQKKTSTPRGSFSTLGMSGTSIADQLQDQLKSDDELQDQLKSEDSDSEEEKSHPPSSATPTPEDVTVYTDTFTDTEYVETGIQTDREEPVQQRETHTQTDTTDTKDARTNTPGLDTARVKVQTEMTMTDFHEDVEPSSEPMPPPSESLPESKEEDKDQLLVGMEVLARWPDDGWYYTGMVVNKCDNDQFVVTDVTGHMEVIAKDNIIIYEENKYHTIQPGDHVVALHPNYVFSFAPGIVRTVYESLGFEVRFYDKTVAEMGRNDVYLISLEKYNDTVQKIVSQKDRLIGKTVVARDDTTGYYKKGVVDDMTDDFHFYNIKWLDDGNQQLQKINHVFVTASGRNDNRNWDHILALANPQKSLYLPGQIIGTVGDTVAVKFCNGARSSNIRLDQSFWLSEVYYQNAVKFFDHVVQSQPQHALQDDADDAFRNKISKDHVITSQEGLRFYRSTVISSG